MNNNKILNYICEVNYPSTSAYSIHVAKMCDAFADKHYQVNLFTPFNNLKVNQFKKKYNLKNNIKIISIFKNQQNLNIISRIIFSLKIIQIIKKKKIKYHFLSRSVVSSLILSIYGYKNILELHHQLQGFTKYFYLFTKILNLQKKISYIFLHKNLITKFITNFNQKYQCLDDAVDLSNFKLIKKNNKKYKKTCIYIGSFYPGKGIEIIKNLSERCKDISFHLYGDTSFINKNFFRKKNVKIFNYIDYKDIPYVLSKYNVALMPYQNKVYVRSKNLNVVKSMSPLKMFDYLASKKIIVASKLEVYKHILKHNHNSILIKPNDHEKWANTITKIFTKLKSYKKLRINSYETAKKYTWIKRANIIEKKLINY